MKKIVCLKTVAVCKMCYMSLSLVELWECIYVGGNNTLIHVPRFLKLQLQKLNLYSSTYIHFKEKDETYFSIFFCNIGKKKINKRFLFHHVISRIFVH